VRWQKRTVRTAGFSEIKGAAAIAPTSFENVAEIAVQRTISPLWLKLQKRGNQAIASLEDLDHERTVGDPPCFCMRKPWLCRDR